MKLVILGGSQTLQLERSLVWTVMAQTAVDPTRGPNLVLEPMDPTCSQKLHLPGVTSSYSEWHHLNYEGCLE